MNISKNINKRSGRTPVASVDFGTVCGVEERFELIMVVEAVAGLELGGRCVQVKAIFYMTPGRSQRKWQ